MSNGVNKVILVGRLGNDPEIRQASNGSIAKLSLATSESWTDKQSGQKQERTEWHKVTLFGPLAGIAKKYLHKGSLIYIEGSLKTDKYENKDGVTVYSTGIVGRTMQMLGGKADSPRQSNGSGQSKPVTSAPVNFEEDVPF